MLFVSVSSSFSPVRLLRLEFRTPYSLVGCSDFSMPSVGVLSWILGSPFFFHCFSSLSAFLQQFQLPFTSVFPVHPSFCFARLCVITCGSPFSSPLSTCSLLLWSFAAFLAVRLLMSNFPFGFSIFYQLSSSVLSSLSRNSVCALLSVVSPSLNPFTPSPHNNIKPPHAELSGFYIAELTFATSCRRQWMGGS